MSVRRILLRAHKDPFLVASPAATLARNLIGNNSGNLIFSQASYKLLRTRDTEVVTSVLRSGAAEADRINAEFDVFVLPLANAFRPSYAQSLERLTELVEKLTIPVVVLGVGAQLRLDTKVARLDRIRELTQRFTSAVLDRSGSIGVRGEYTHDYLRQLGFRDVEVIGCPSLYMYGPDLQVHKGPAELTTRSRVSINISPYVRQIGPVLTRHHQRYPKLRYVAQDRASLRLMLLGDDPQHQPAAPDLPTHGWHPMLAENKTRFFVDPAPWLDYLRRFDFSFGTRIHGNIASLLAGTPCYVLAHDSRTLELARYFDIPHRTMAGVGPDLDAGQLYAEADYTAFNAGHAARFADFAGYLARHGLRHVFEPGEDSQAFERQVAATSYPPGVQSRPPGSRLRRLARGVGMRLRGRTQPQPE